MTSSPYHLSPRQCTKCHKPIFWAPGQVIHKLIWVQWTPPIGYNCCNHYEPTDEETMFLVIWMHRWSLVCLKTLWGYGFCSFGHIYWCMKMYIWPLARYFCIQLCESTVLNTMLCLKHMMFISFLYGRVTEKVETPWFHPSSFPPNCCPALLLK